MHLRTAYLLTASLLFSLITPASLWAADPPAASKSPTPDKAKPSLTEPGKIKQYNQETAQAFSANDVRSLIYAWFDHSDKLEAPESYYPLMVEEAEHASPAGVMRGRQEFAKWRQAASAELKENLHLLSPISVTKVDKDTWFADFSVEFCAAYKQKPESRQKINQHWLVVNDEGNLRLKRREIEKAQVLPVEEGWNNRGLATSTNTANGVESFIYHWFAGFDRQKPDSYFLAMLGSNPNMAFPNFPINGRGDFLKWYDNVKTNIYWNDHLLSNFQVKAGETRATSGQWFVSFDVRWQAICYDGQLISNVIHQDLQLKSDSQGQLTIERHRAQ